jgi:putative endonuclease
MEKIYYLYILECANGAYYTGYTTDIVRRYSEHQQGTAKCKYTRSYPPKNLAACWQITSSLSTVLKIECYIKRRNKAQKRRFIQEPALLQREFTALSLCVPLLIGECGQ